MRFTLFDVHSFPNHRETFPPHGMSFRARFVQPFSISFTISLAGRQLSTGKCSASFRPAFFLRLPGRGMHKEHLLHGLALLLPKVLYPWCRRSFHSWHISLPGEILHGDVVNKCGNGWICVPERDCTFEAGLAFLCCTAICHTNQIQIMLNLWTATTCFFKILKQAFKLVLVFLITPVAPAAKIHRRQLNARWLFWEMAKDPPVAHSAHFTKSRCHRDCIVVVVHKVHKISPICTAQRLAHPSCLRLVFSVDVVDYPANFSPSHRQQTAVLPESI